MSWVMTAQNLTDLYSNYRDYDAFAQRMAQFVNLGVVKTRKIGIAGVGFGYLLQRMVLDGYTDAWGFDASSYAIAEAQNVLTNQTAKDRLMVADALVSGDMTAFKSFAGLQGGQRFNYIFSEEMLSCAASDAEVTTMVNNLGAIAQTVIHLVTPSDENAGVVDDTLGLMWKTGAEWKALVGGHVLVSSISLQVI